MDILELITGNKKKRAKGHLRNLMEVAASDGSFEGIEVDYLLSLAGRFNISEEELKKIQDQPDAVKYEPPATDKERFDHLYQLACMMMIDGVVHDKEVELCKKFAIKLNLKPEFVDDMVAVINQDEKKEIPTDIVIGKLLKIAQERGSSKIE